MSPTLEFNDEVGRVHVGRDGGDEVRRPPHSGQVNTTRRAPLKDLLILETETLQVLSVKSVCVFNTHCALQKPRSKRMCVNTLVRVV